MLCLKVMQSWCLLSALLSLFSQKPTLWGVALGSLATQIWELQEASLAMRKGYFSLALRHIAGSRASLSGCRSSHQYSSMLLDIRVSTLPFMPQPDHGNGLPTIASFPMHQHLYFIITVHLSFTDVCSLEHVLSPVSSRTQRDTVGKAVLSWSSTGNLLKWFKKGLF